MIMPANNASVSEMGLVLAKGILKQCGPEALDEGTQKALAAPTEEPQGFLSRWLHLTKPVTVPKAVDEIGVLRAAIQRLRGHPSTHLTSAPVVVRANGETVWEGIVEVFSLTGRPIEGRVFAWMHRRGSRVEDTRYVTMLEVGRWIRRRRQWNCTCGVGTGDRRGGCNRSGPIAPAAETGGGNGEMKQ